MTLAAADVNPQQKLVEPRMCDDGVYGPGYDFGEEHGTLYVDARCPTCQRFISHKRVQVSINGLGEVSLAGFRCSRCGEVTPGYEWE